MVFLSLFVAVQRNPCLVFDFYHSESRFAAAPFDLWRYCIRKNGKVTLAPALRTTVAQPPTRYPPRRVEGRGLGHKAIINTK